MPKAKKIRIPEEICKHYNLDIESIQERVQVIVSSRVGMTEENLFDPITMVKEYDGAFSKNELLGMYIGAISDCGFIEFKLEKIIEHFQLPFSEVQKVFQSRIENEDIIKVYKAKDNDEPEQESFI